MSPPATQVFLAAVLCSVLAAGSPTPGSLITAEQDALRQPNSTTTPSSLAFVRVNGTQFFADPANRSAYYFVGANYWAGMSLGSSGPGGDRSRLMADLDALQKAGVTQLRILGSTEGPDSEPWRIVPSLQPCPGVYNAAVLDGFDYLVAEMGKRRMRATVVMGDEWAWSGGHAQLVRWAQKQAGPPNAAACAATPRLQPNISDPSWRQRGFEDIPYPGPGGNSWSDYQALSGLLYTTPAAQALWEKHATFLTSHVNAYTGLRLRDDPVIMAWQLANEPRAASEDAKPAFFAWLDGASRFLKAAAPRQLVCAGGEGDTAYFSPSQALAASQAMPALDYVTAHLWVQNWGRYHPAMTEQAFVNSTIAWALKYVAASAAEASRLQKPLVLEEFGLPRDLGSLSPAAPTSRRNVYFATIFRSVTDSAAAQGVLAGANFWAFAGRGRPGAAGIPATSTQLCKGAAVSGGLPMRSFTGAPPDWGACFTDQGSRPAACPADSWWAVQSAWPPGSPPGLDTFLGDPPHESQGWYSVYGTDSTVAVVAAANRRLVELAACAGATVDGGAPACAAEVPSGAIGNLCIS